MATTCPPLNSLTSNTLVTVQNQKELRLSTYNRTESASVSLWCVESFTLYGQNKVTCQSDGTWDFSTKPCCDETDCTGSGGELSQQTQILIGVLVGVSAVVVLIMFLIICIIMAKIKKRKQEERKLYRDDSSSRLGYMLDERAYFPPPYSWHPMSYPYASQRKNLLTSNEKERTSLTDYSAYSNVISSDRHAQGRDQGSFKAKNEIVDRTQRSAIISGDENVTDMYYRSRNTARSLDGDRLKIDQYRPKSIEPVYAQTISVPYRIRSVDAEYARSEPEYSRPWIYQTTSREPEVVSTNIFQRSREPEVAPAEIFQIRSAEPGSDIHPVRSGRSDLFKITRIEPDLYQIKTADQVKSENQAISTLVPGQSMVKTKNAFKDDSWNRPLDNVYVSRNKVTTGKTAPNKRHSTEPKTQYQGYWPARSSMKELKDFNRRALLNGRDPFLWSNVNSNFGFHIDYND